MILGELWSAYPHRQFHTLPGLLDSWAALSNSNPNALRAMQGGSLYHFYDGFWYDPAGRRTHDLPCERRTRWPLSKPDTVADMILVQSFFDIEAKTILYISSNYTYLFGFSWRRSISKVTASSPQLRKVCGESWWRANCKDQNSSIWYRISMDHAL